MDKELEKAANNWVTQPVIGTRRESFMAGAKWQAERMYSEEDLKKAFKVNYTPFSATNIGDFDKDWNKWFEQFKKK